MRVEQALVAQRGHLIGWVPVCLGLGIAAYFGMRVEPGLAAFAGAAVLGAAALVGLILSPLWLRPLAIGLCLGAVGFVVAGARAHAVAAPVLGFRYYGPIEGRIIEVDRSASDAVRLTLDQVVLEDMRPDRTPARVRVALHGDQGWIAPEPGKVIILTGHLSPPGGPTEPGGFDFQRNAWFDQIGAVGYTRTPVLTLDYAPDTWALWIGRVRLRLSAAVQAGIEGESGALAAALTTGDRSAMGLATIKDLRSSNLAHLVSISGLHMGLLAGFVFALVRVGMALTPLGLRVNSKKIAAALALVAATVYLALSGAAVATERSWIMIAVMLVAVLLDRRALSLRSVAIAATIILLTRPEELAGPGFQMSFSATVALVAAFGVLPKLGLYRWPGWARHLGTLVFSSLVAGLATAPFGAAHFNQFSHFGLIANLLSVPLMGAVVMPGAVVAACLAPIGLEGLAFAFMDVGLRWILWVAHWVSGLDGSVGHVVAPRGWILPALTLGGLVVILWQGRGRWVGLAPVAIALAFWPSSPRPALLVAETGALMGMMTEDGRALSKAVGDGFAGDSWLENDGVPIDRDAAFARPGLDRDGRLVRAVIGGQEVLLVSGKTALAALSGCGGAAVLVTNQADDLDRPCDVFDVVRLRRTGSIAIEPAQDGGLKITTATDVTGARLWNTPMPRRR